MAHRLGAVKSEFIAIPGRDRGGGSGGSGGSVGGGSVGSGTGSFDDSPSLYGTPKFSPATTNTLEDTEKLGIPLKTSWTFWYDRYKRGLSAAEYEANLKKVYSVRTIQGFWSVYNHIPAVGKIGMASYHMMRGDRRPIWEDELNVKGGYWKMRIPKNKTSLVWKELLLALIGEQFQDFVGEGDNIVGLSVSNRDRDDIIQIWNSNCTGIKEGSSNNRVLQKLAEIIPDVDISGAFYKAHQAHEAFETLKQQQSNSGSRGSSFDNFARSSPLTTR